MIKKIPLVSSVPMEQPEMETPQISKIPLSTSYTGETAPVFSKYKLKDFEGYFDYGVDPLFKDIELERAKNQPWYEQAGAMLNQAVVGSVIGQTIESIGTLLEIPDIIAGDYSMDNPVYNLGKSITDWAAETTPIYQTGDRFSDTGYWFQGLTSAASAASFLLPGWGITKALELGAKGLKLGTTATRLLQTSVGAIGMRHMEGAMEAEQVHEQLMNQFNVGLQEGKFDNTNWMKELKANMNAEIEALPIRLPNPETGEVYSNEDAIASIREKYRNLALEKGKQFADEGARLTYISDYSNLIFDVVQLGAVLKPFSGLTRNVKVPLGVAERQAELLGKTAKPWYGKLGYRMLDASKTGLVELTEGIEEGVNYIASQEGQRHGEIQMGLREDDGTEFGDRLSGYVGDEEFTDSFIFGAIGGVGFKALGRAIGMDEGKSIVDRKNAEISARGELVKERVNTVKDILSNPDITPEDKKSALLEVADDLGNEIGLRGAMAGNMDLVEEWLNSPQLNQELTQLGFGDETSNREVLAKVKESALNAEDLYKKYYTGLYQYQMSDAARNIMIANRMSLDQQILENDSKLKDLNKQYTELVQKDAWFLTKGQTPQNFTALNQFATQLAIAGMELQMAEETNPEAKSAMENIIKELNKQSDLYSKELETLHKQAKELKLPFETPTMKEISGVDKRIINNLSQSKVLTLWNKELGNKLADKNTKEQINKDIKESEEKVNKVKEEIINREKENKVKAEEEKAKTAVIKKWNKTIDKAVNDKELDSIIDQMDKAGVSTNELLDRVAKKRESLKVTPKETVQPKEKFIDNEQSVSYEQKVADIERRRLEELFGGFKINDNRKNTKEGKKRNTRIKVNSDGTKISFEGYIEGEPTVGLNPAYPKMTLEEFKNSEFYKNLKPESKQNFEDLVEGYDDIIEISLHEIRISKNDSDIIGKGNSGVTISIHTKEGNISDISFASNTSEINAKYDAELEALEQDKVENDTVDVITNSNTYDSNTGDNPPTVDDSNIEINEVNTRDFKRVQAVGLAYRASKFVVKGADAKKITISYEDIDPITLSLSDWNTLQNGDEVELSLDTEFDGNVQVYDNNRRVLNSDGTPLTEKKTYNEIKDEDKPIKVEITKNGVKTTIGYLFTESWAKAITPKGDKYENIANEDDMEGNAEVQINALKKLRAEILKQGADKVHKFKVRKSHGHLAVTTETEKIDGKTRKINKPVNEALPKFAESDYFEGDYQPLAIWSGSEFVIGTNRVFPREGIAISDESWEELTTNRNNKYNGGVFILVPTAVRGKFMPTPVNIPAIDSNIVDSIIFAINANINKDTETSTKIFNNTGLDISTRNGLRQFMSQYIYLSSAEAKGISRGVPRIVFSVADSRIEVWDRGEQTLVIDLNNPKNRIEKLEQLKDYLALQRMTVKSEHLNSTKKFGVPSIKTNEEGKQYIDFETTTFNKYAMDRLTTDLVELNTTDGTPIYMIQPTIDFIGDITVEPTTPTPTTPVTPDDFGDLPEGFFDDVLLTQVGKDTGVIKSENVEGIITPDAVGDEYGGDFSISEGIISFLPLKGNEEIYKEYNLLSEDGKLKKLPDNAKTKKWVDTLNKSPYYQFRLRHLSDGTHRILIVNPYSDYSPAISEDIIPTKLEQVQYKLKAVNILLSDKAKQVFAKGEKAKWDLNKILTELAIPKEQKQLLLDLGITDREQLALELASKYGFSVEINTAKENKITNIGEFDEDGHWIPYEENEYEISKESTNTQYYSNLTVPGGTNYTENEISTPLITPSIKGHAQFSTNNGIGWFRSDEQVNNGQIEDDLSDLDEGERYYAEQIAQDHLTNTKRTIGGILTKTRRILEIQSDLFQKGRNESNLAKSGIEVYKNFTFNGDTYTSVQDNNHKKNNTPISKEEYRKIYNEYKESKNKYYKNQFLQLLNKDNNWVTFFIKSIIQDSAKKGYEKVLFPKGETAAKIEGHETIAEEVAKTDSLLEIYKQELKNAPDNAKWGLLGEVWRKETFDTKEEAEKWIENNKLYDFAPELLPNQKRPKNEVEKDIAILEKRKQELKSQGIEKLKPIEAFYEIKVGNILEKQFGKENVKTITDEYGNEWREISIDQIRDSSEISLAISEETVERVKELGKDLLVTDGDYTFGAGKQKQIVDNIKFLVYTDLLSLVKEGKRMAVSKAFSNAKESLVKTKKNIEFIANLTEEKFQQLLNNPKAKELYGHIESVEQAKYIASELERITKDEVFKQFEGQVVQDLKVLGITVKEENLQELSDIEKEEIEMDNEVQIEDNDFQNEKNYSVEVFQVNPRNTAGINVKLMLSKIPNSNRNYLGLSSYIPFDTVFDDLTVALSPVEGSLKSYIQEMKNIINGNPAKSYLKNLVEVLESPETATSMKNQFVAVMNKHLGNFVLTLWKRTPNGMEVQTKYANENSAVSVIVNQWAENMGQSRIVTTDSKGNKHIDKTVAAELNDKIKQLQGKGKEAHKEFMLELFDALGIFIDPNIVDVLYNTTQYKELDPKGKRKGNFEYQFTYSSTGVPQGVFSAIVDALNKENSKEIIEAAEDLMQLNNPFDGANKNSSVTFLAQVVAKYSNVHYASSHRNVENKMIYDSSFHIPITSRIKDLNVPNSPTRAILKELPFSSTAYWLSDSAKNIKLIMHDMDGLKERGKNTDGVTRTSMSEREQEFTSIGLFQDTESEHTAKFIGMTMSDKPRTPIIEAPKFKVNINTTTLKDRHITKETLTEDSKEQISNLVKAEAARIRNIRQRIKEDIDNKLKNEVGEQYYNGAQFFYFFPELNGLVYKDGKLDDTMLLNENLQVLIDTALDKVVETVNNTIDKWWNIGIVYRDKKNKIATMFNKNYVSNSHLKENALVAYAATDIELNYIVFNANMMQLVQGDPAKFYNQKKVGKFDVVTRISKVMDEYQKREAKDAAPGEIGTADWEFTDKNGIVRKGRPTYNVVFAADDKFGSITQGYLQTMPSYTEGLDRTDAQELTTLREHIDLLMNHGRIPDDIYASIMKKIEDAGVGGYYELTYDELGMVLGPQKPVQIVSRFDNGVESTFYIKSSSYPLIPQLTRGFGEDSDIEKIRVNMEKNNVDRLAFITATKIGARNTVELFKDGKVVEDLDFSDKLNQLSRKGFTIQQDVPYDPKKHEIVVISQMDRLLMQGLSDVEFEFKGKKLLGKELKKIKENLRGQLMDMSKEDIFDRMGIEMVDGNPVVRNLDKLISILREEAIDRKWAVNDIMALQIVDGNLVIPLAFNNSAERVETLISSLFTKIIKQKISGKSFVQASSSGYKNNTKTLDDLTASDKKGIVFLKGTGNDFNPKTGLTYTNLNEETKEVKVAQVFIPWKYSGNLEDFVKEGTSELDLNKIDPELLKMIGARIPNQGHSSQIVLQVVGFLPKVLGDLVIVPGEITKQMGSDFDVDKLYTYMYNNVVNAEGRLVKVPSAISENGDIDTKSLMDWAKDNFAKGKLDFGALSELDEDTDKKIKEGLKLAGLSKKALIKAALQNAYIEVHETVLTNSEVVKKSLTPLDADDLSITGDNASTKQDRGLFISRDRQLKDFIRQQAGKSGVAIMSRAVVGGAMIEDYNLRLGTPTEKGYKDTPFKGFLDDSGDAIALINLSGEGKTEFNGEERTKTRNTIIMQSGAVDNANKPVLDSNNLNSFTFNTAIAINRLSSEEGRILDLRYTSYFLNQEVIKDYINELKSLSDTLNEEFTADRKNAAVEKVKENYLKRAGLKEYKVVGKGFTPQMMLDLIKSNEKNSNEYIKDQLEILEHFVYLDTVGTELNEIYGALSTESKGVGKGYWDVLIRQEQLRKLGRKSTISGAAELLEEGSQANKIAGYVYDAVKVMSQIFPYQTTQVQEIINTIEIYAGKTYTDKNLRQLIWENIKSYIFTHPDLATTPEDRNALFYGENSVAKEIERFKKTPEGFNNRFMQRVRTKLGKTADMPDLVLLNASAAERTDEQEVVKHFVDLLTSPNEGTRELGERLIQYQFATGGLQKALQYVKYIPVSYLATTNFGTKLMEIINSLNDENSININAFIEQFYQHNPARARIYKEEVTDKILNEGIKFNVETDRVNNLLYTKDNVQDYVPYISIRDKKGNWVLLKKERYEGITLVYKPIAVLGGHGKDYTSYNEYKFDTENVVSTIESNNPKNTILPQSKIVPTTKEEPTITNTEVYTVKGNKYVNPFNASPSENLNFAMANLETERFKALAPLFTKNSNLLSDKFEIIIDNNLEYTDSEGNKRPARGLYYKGKVYLNPKVINNNVKTQGRELTTEDIEKTLMHELGHAYTADLYRIYSEGGTHKLLTSKVKQNFERIDALRNVAYNMLTKEEKEKVNKIKTGKYGTPEQGINNEDLKTYYGFINTKEFISEVLTKPEFQKKLNEMSLNSTTSVFERVVKFIKDIYNEFIKTLGFTVEQNSVLENSLLEVMDLIHNSENIEATTELTEETLPNITNKFTFSDGITIDTGNIELNAQQKEVLQQLADFYNNPFEKGNKTFALKGYAGTGKTTIMRFLTEYANKKKVFSGVKFSSPTHRANAVLKNSVGKDVFTLHALFGLSPEVDLEEFDARDTKFSMQNDAKLNYGNFLIIDESSMINDELYKFITEFSNNLNTKVLFVGDPAQIKPVKQTHLSKAFDSTDKSYELTKVERTGKNPLLAEVTSIRSGNVLSNTSNVNDSGEGVVFINNEEVFLTKAVNLFTSEEFKDNPMLLRIITGTNAGVASLNSTIRKGIFKENSNKQFNEDEILMGYSNFRVNKDTKQPLIMNSGDYKVISVSPEREVSVEGISIKIFDLTLQNLLDTNSPSIFIPVLTRNNTQETLEKLGEKFEEVRQYAIAQGKIGNKKAWLRFYDFKNAFATTQEIKYKGLLKIPKTLDYGYTHTIHKSQGGTYTNIFVDDRTVESGFKQDKELQQQLRYVGLSRAKKTAYVMTNNEVKVGKIDVDLEISFDFTTFTNLGTTVGEYMKTLSKEQRELLRELMDNKTIEFRCK